jgi:magnesium-transporting ATPase (P-type)
MLVFWSIKGDELFSIWNDYMENFVKICRRLIYGNNEIKVEVKSIVKLLFLEVLNPFYVFQIFSVSLWLSDNYVYYAIAITIMSIFGITSTIIQTRKVRTSLSSLTIACVHVTLSSSNQFFDDIRQQRNKPTW